MPAMITTVDNPFDPRTDYSSWYQWDIENGYKTCSYLDRVAMVADDLPDAIRDSQIERAIDEIIEIHAGGLYKKLILTGDEADPGWTGVNSGGIAVEQLDEA